MEKEKTKESLEVTIEEATIEAVKAMSEIKSASWLATYPNDDYGISKEDIAQLLRSDSTWIERWRKRIEANNPNQKIFVARAGGMLVGYCAVVKGEEFNKLTSIYIHPNVTGSGIGSKLIASAFEWLGGDADIVVMVASYNEQAKNFYEKHGFQFVEEDVEPSPLSEEKSIPQIKMVRRGTSSASNLDTENRMVSNP